MKRTSSGFVCASVSRSIALFLLCSVLALPTASFATHGAFIFHSPGDDGTIIEGCAYPLEAPFSSESLACLLQGIPAPESLNLYADPGLNSDLTHCSGLCGIHAVIEVEGAFFTSFDAALGVSHAPGCEAPTEVESCPLPPMTDRVTVVASFASVAAGPYAPLRKIGTLNIDVPAPTGNRADGASVSVNGVEIIEGGGAAVALPTEFIALPEPGLPLQWLCGVLGLAALNAKKRSGRGRRR